MIKKLKHTKRKQQKPNETWPNSPPSINKEKESHII